VRKVRRIDAGFGPAADTVCYGEGDCFGVFMLVVRDSNSDSAYEEGIFAAVRAVAPSADAVLVFCYA
jgi:hypothetical protein